MSFGNLWDRRSPWGRRSRWGVAAQGLAAAAATHAIAAAHGIAASHGVAATHAPVDVGSGCGRPTSVVSPSAAAFGSLWDRFGVDPGSLWGRPKVILRSTWGRAGVDFGSFWGRSRFTIRAERPEVKSLRWVVPRLGLTPEEDERARLRNATRGVPKSPTRKTLGTPSCC